MNDEKYGEVSNRILESFFHFIDRTEQNGKRVVDQWIAEQDESGNNVITHLFS